MNLEAHAYRLRKRWVVHELIVSILYCTHILNQAIT